MSRKLIALYLARFCCIMLALLCMFGGMFFPPLHMLGGIPVLCTIALLIPWPRLAAWFRQRFTPTPRPPQP